MIKRFFASLLAVLMLLSFVSCGKKDEKKNEGLGEYNVGSSDKFEIDAGMYAYFMYDYVGMYEYYITNFGYDPTKTLSEQEGKCHLDESKTWFEYFSSLAEGMIKKLVALASKALDEGMKISEQDKKDIDDYIKEADEEAYKQGYDGINGLLAEYYVEGITSDSFRKCIELQILASQYVDKYASELEKNEYSDEILLDYVDRHPEMFLGVDYVHYTFFGAYNESDSDEVKEAAYAEAKKRAENFITDHPTAESFKQAIVDKENEGEDIPYDADVILFDFVQEYEIYDMEEDASDADKTFYEWAYSKDRKEGDTFIREHKSSNGALYYTAYFMLKPAYVKDYVTKNVSHIFFEVNTDLTGDALQEDAKKAYDKAVSVLEEYKNGEMTKESFFELAKKYSEDSNADVGGVYENVTLDVMMPEFEEWIYKEGRAVGETEIIQTEYGYHIMYFVGDGYRFWEVGAREGYMEELYNAHETDLVAQYPTTFNPEAIKNIP